MSRAPNIDRHPEALGAQRRASKDQRLRPPKQSPARASIESSEIRRRYGQLESGASKEQPAIRLIHLAISTRKMHRAAGFTWGLIGMANG